MKIAKLVISNILVFFSLLGLLLVVPPTAVKLYRTAQPPLFSYINSLPQYRNAEWLDTYLSEYSKLTRTYRDYVVWRSRDQSGLYINVEDGFRRSVNYGSERKSTYFFGGSTMWGVGVKDDDTIPSIFSRITGSQTVNFGENGYVVRQSLAALQNYYLLAEKADLKRLIVFYDGVNDVVDRCDIRASVLGSNQEERIKRISNLGVFSYEQTFFQLQNFIANLREKITTRASDRNRYICALDPERAREVALTMVKAWQSASKLAEDNGDEFLAILQPVAFVGEPRLEYLSTDTWDHALRFEYEIVYPLIVKFAQELEVNFLDLTGAFDDCEFCYIDFCHVSQEGNLIIASAIRDNLIR